MKGRSPIVLRMENHAFFEHADAEGALAEAKRLANDVGGTFVVYVPVLAVSKPLFPIVRRIPVEGIAGNLADDDDLPF